MKKLIVLIIVFALALSLSACKEKSNELVIGRWGGNEQETTSFDQVVADFVAENDGLEVVVRTYTDYNLELQAEIIAGNGPDVFYVDAFMAPFYIAEGLIAPLSSDDFTFDDYYPNLLNAFAQDGEYYAIPKDYSTLALYYNKAIIPNGSTIPTTFEALYGSDYLTNLALPDGMDAAMTFNLDLARNLWMAEVDGQSVIVDNKSNLGDLDVVANLQLMFDAAKAGKIVRPADIGQGWNGDAFGNEETAIMIEGNWVVGHLNNNFSDVDYGVLELPTYKGEHGSMLFTVGWGLNAQAKNSENGIKFINYFSGYDGMMTWCGGTGTLPSRADVASALNVDTDPVLGKHVSAVAYATVWQRGTNLNIINTEYMNYGPSVYTGDNQRTLAAALQLAEDEANAIIEENE